jgi:3-oxoacyl-[acyl-carrier-protein] synthase-3
MYRNVYLGAIRYVAGSLRAIEEEIVNPDTLARLRSDSHGANTYARHDGSVAELLEDVIRECMSSVPYSSAQIDAIFCVSCEADVTNNLHPVWMAQLSQRLSLERVPHYHIGITGCAGFHWAAKLASALIASGDAHHVLVVTFDKAGPRLERLYGEGDNFMYMTGDAAAACLISSESDGMDYKLIGKIEHVYDSVQMLAPSTDSEINKIADLFAATYASAGKSADEIKHLVTNNYSLDISRLYCQLAEVSYAKVFTDTIATHAHCFSSDNLINLRELTLHRSLAEGDAILCFSAGPMQWGACILERLEARQIAI